MSKTQRCETCTTIGRRQELWEDEVCRSCGRCTEHCTAPHVNVFSVNARQLDGRPHDMAGKVDMQDGFEVRFQPDKDRPRA